MPPWGSKTCINIYCFLCGAHLIVFVGAVDPSYGILIYREHFRQFGSPEFQHRNHVHFETIIRILALLQLVNHLRETDHAHCFPFCNASSQKDLILFIIWRIFCIHVFLKQRVFSEERFFESIMKFLVFYYFLLLCCLIIENKGVFMLITNPTRCLIGLIIIINMPEMAIWDFWVPQNSCDY